MKIGKIEANSSIYNIQEFQIDNPLFYDKLVKWLRDFEDISGLRFNESLNNLVKLYARIANHDYVVGVSDNPAAKNDRFWSDYYSDEPSEIETIEIKVPQNMVQDLLTQGTSAQEYSSGYEAYSEILKHGYILEKSQIVMLRKDISINDTHFLEAGDLVKINGSPIIDDANSFILDSPIIINDMYVEKGDFITIIKSKRDDDKSDNDDDTDKKNETDKEDKKDKSDEDTVDLEIKEQVIIGKYIFEIGDKIKIIPQSRNTSVSRMNERVFRTNKNLTIDGKTIVEGSLIEFLKKDKKPVINISGSDVNILRETWV